GVDRRRSLPELHRNHFRRWFARRGSFQANRDREGAGEPVDHPLPHGRGSPRRVVLLDDCFTTYQEPQIGRAAVELLERAGFGVELAGVCCGRALISKGFLSEARILAREGLAKLDRFAAAGIPILGLEPSCILALADEWPELVPGAAAKHVAESVELADAWIARQVRDNGVALDLPNCVDPALLHAHCHQKALFGAQG